MRELAASHELVITIEEGSIGGFGAHVMDYLSGEGMLDGPLKIRSMKLPDAFQEHGNPADMYADAGLNADGIVDIALKAFGHNALDGENRDMDATDKSASA